MKPQVIWLLLTLSLSPAVGVSIARAQECLEFIEAVTSCGSGLSSGEFVLRFRARNQASHALDRIFLWPLQDFSISPSEFYVDPGVAQGTDTDILEVFVTGAAVGGLFIIDVTTHNSDTGECCQERIFATVPDCIPVEDDRFRRGDANGDGNVDLSDGVFILDFLFLGGTRPACISSADTNGSGDTDISDAITLFDFLFLGGDSPADPGPRDCGRVPPGLALGCNTYNAC